MRSLSVLKIHKLESRLLLLGAGLLPIYVFSSGGIQPAHMVLALFAIIGLLRRRFPAEIWLLSLLGISIYSFIVESFYVVAGVEVASLMSSIFFFYNFFLVWAIYSYCKRYGLSALTLGIISACVIAIVSVSVNGVSLQEAGQGRTTGAFNNPNQLGYFSVCFLSLTYLLYRHGHLKYIVAVGMFAIAIFLSIASLSKAAMVANFVVAFLAIKPVRLGASKNSILSSVGVPLFWILITILGLSYILALYVEGAFDGYLFVKRLQGMMSEGDSSLEARGYFVFLEGTTLQILFGFGSKGIADILGHEVHSTLASVLNNYGLVGFLLFSSALVAWAVNLWRAYGFIGMCCLSGPVMLYGITHNGIRFTAFWILFSASMAMASNIMQQRKSRDILTPAPG